MKANNLMEYLIRSLEKELSEERDQVKEITAELAKAKQQMEKSNEHQQSLEQKLSEMTLKGDDLTNSKEQLDMMLASERLTNNNLKREIEDLRKKLVELEETRRTSLKAEEYAEILKDKETEIELKSEMVFIVVFFI